MKPRPLDLTPKELEDDEDSIPLMHSREELEQIAKALMMIEERQRYRRMDFFTPYPKQMEFFDLGAVKGERMLRAGNQLGKTEAGAFECACHLTGEYPDWWMGKRFDHPTKGWAVGLTTQVTRDVIQEKLCGEPGVEIAFGSGFIPKDRFAAAPTLARGITGAYDTLQVEHRTDGVLDGISTLTFKSAEQGREKFQSKTLDFFWSDEEAPFPIYTELLARISATNGMGYVTFTPLSGRTTLVEHFAVTTPDRGLVIMKSTDAKHMTPEMIAKNMARYPKHEHAARINGEPMLGSGRIFPWPDEMVAEAPLEYIPQEWTKGWGVDFGVGDDASDQNSHPFAAVLCAWDKDNDVIHVIRALKMWGGGPMAHARAMKPIGVNVPVSWPHDGNAKENASYGESVATLYKKEGLRMQPTHAQFLDGGYSTEAGVLEMQERMQTGRLKFGRELSDLFEEYREYHRKDGMIVKLRDDLLSALRIAIIDKRNWKLCVLGGQKSKPKRSHGDMGLDIDPFTGQ